MCKLPTQRVLEAGDSAVFTSIFLAESERVMSQMLMELEAQQLNGAERHE